jgi:hypothetical protein
MTELLKEDIPVLNFIIDELCKSGVYSITSEYLVDKKVFDFGKNIIIDDLVSIEKDSKEFERLVSIIEDFKCAMVTRNTGLGNPLSISRNEKTLQFKRLGNFENEFKKQNKKTWHNEPWVGYLIAFITLLFVFYQGYQNNNLGKDISSLEKSVDSINFVILSENRKHDSLNIQFRSFEKKLSDLKIEIEQ